MAISEIRRAALEYALAGWRVIPLHGVSSKGGCTCGWQPGSHAPEHPVGKHPRISDWPNKATTDTQVIDDWFTRWPDSNLGLATGDLFELSTSTDPRGSSP